MCIPHTRHPGSALPCLPLPSITHPGWEERNRSDFVESGDTQGWGRPSFWTKVHRASLGFVSWEEIDPRRKARGELLVRDPGQGVGTWGQSYL